MSGCGGAGGGTFVPGEVSGVVSDSDGGTVRDALVFEGDVETFSNSGGIYVLMDVAPGQRVIRAELTKNGIDYSGQNVTTVFEGERSKNVNIAVVRTDRQARIHGTVRDGFGNRISGARIFAFGNAFTSSIAITNSSGNYEIRGLASGVTYTVTASARRFNSDVDTALMSPGQNRELDFELSDESNATLPAPENLTALAWTSPFEATRSVNQASGIEAIKRMRDPRRAARMRSSRTTSLGNHVEVDLYWDPLPSQYYTSLLGFGVYRSLSPVGLSSPIDFLRDPNALFFADIDDGLVEGAVYYYEITALNTTYPDSGNSESLPSNRYGVETLGDMEALPASGLVPTFQWFPALGAEEYVVYLFDEFPGIGVTTFWSNEGNPAAGTSLTYSGPALTPGRRYYFVVLGLANGNTSLTISRIGDFVAN